MFRMRYDLWIGSRRVSCLFNEPPLSPSPPPTTNAYLLGGVCATLNCEYVLNILEPRAQYANAIARKDVTSFPRKLHCAQNKKDVRLADEKVSRCYRQCIFASVVNELHRWWEWLTLNPWFILIRYTLIF